MLDFILKDIKVSDGLKTIVDHFTSVGALQMIEPKDILEHDPHLPTFENVKEGEYL